MQTPATPIRNTTTTTTVPQTPGVSQQTKAVDSDTLTLKGAVKDFFSTLPHIAFLSAAGAAASYAFTATVIPPLGGAVLLGAFGSIVLISFIACKLLLNSSDEFALITSIIAGLFLVNVVATATFPPLGYQLPSRTYVSLFTAGTSLATFCFARLFPGTKPG